MATCEQGDYLPTTSIVNIASSPWNWLTGAFVDLAYDARTGSVDTTKLNWILQ
jgi:hypothetical protein